MPDNTIIDLTTGEPADDGEEVERPSFRMSGHLFRLWNMSLQQRAFDVLTVME